MKRASKSDSLAIGMTYRICFVLTNFFKYCQGGAELQAYFIANELATKGRDVHYIFVRNPAHLGNATLKDGHVDLHALKQHDFGKLGKYYFLNYYELLNLLKEINPDIVYQRRATAHTGIVSRYAVRNKKIFVWATSSNDDCQKRISAKLKGQGAIAYVIDHFFARYGMKHASQIVAQTQYQASLLRKGFGLDSIIIPNAHPVPKAVGRKPNSCMIVWIANIKEMKRPEIFVELARALPDLDAKFVLVGRSSVGRYQTKLEARIDGISNLAYAGELSFEEVNRLVSRASIFVNTSLPHEGFPNTFIQAWMRNVPTVSLDFDPDNVIKKNKIGFHSKTFEQLVKDVRLLDQNKALREEMGQRARRYAVAKHDIAKVGRLYNDLFEYLLKKERDEDSLVEKNVL